MFSCQFSIVKIKRHIHSLLSYYNKKWRSLLQWAFNFSLQTHSLICFWRSTLFSNTFILVSITLSSSSSFDFDSKSPLNEDGNGSKLSLSSLVSMSVLQTLRLFSVLSISESSMKGGRLSGIDYSFLFKDSSLSFGWKSWTFFDFRIKNLPIDDLNMSKFLCKGFETIHIAVFSKRSDSLFVDWRMSLFLAIG